MQLSNFRLILVGTKVVTKAGQEMPNYDELYISKIFCYYSLTKTIFHEVIFLQCFHGWAMALPLFYQC